MKKFRTLFLLVALLLVMSCPSDDSVEEDMIVKPITFEHLSSVFN